MAQKLRPLHDRVLIKRVESETTSKGGIIIPENAKEKPLEGEVIAVGTGRVLEDGSVRALQVKANDRVLFSKYSETEVKIGGENFLLLREDDLLGIIER
ncbi:MAG: co-chaperone GroES [Deltaproteobacteria bacterium]|nr:co-chaperone GroES [Deltaproteobacteria bacterium]